MKLSKLNLLSIEAGRVKLPNPEVLFYPEKIVQFGTGVFVRGLIDYLIDKANNEGIFKGRVVVVKSTSTGDTTAFKTQDNLYTLIMKSVEDGIEVEETVICASISRVLNANEEWRAILECAANPDLQIIISNTTEVGIEMLQDDPVTANPPISFPAKLLAFLYERFRVFKGLPGSGMVIIPTELIPGNATKLKAIVNELALQNNLDAAFISWLNEHNDFCNSLVDRIVPGKLTSEAQADVEKKLGYQDDLMIMSETFALWAIETSNERTKKLLSFSTVHPQVYIVPDIEKFRELKLRLLNGSHNLSCALGVVAGFKTVKEAMANKVFDRYMQVLIQEEIAAAIVSEKITLEEAKQFGAKVIDRYRNPYIEFEWLSICVQDTSKIRIRAVPIVLQYYQKYSTIPDCISLGFAAYILFMKSERGPGNEYIGLLNNMQYNISDDFAENLYMKWKTNTGINLVKAVLEDQSLWGTDLTLLKGFAGNVSSFLSELQATGFVKTVEVIGSVTPVNV